MISYACIGNVVISARFDVIYALNTLLLLLFDHISSYALSIASVASLFILFPTTSGHVFQAWCSLPWILYFALRGIHVSVVVTDSELRSQKADISKKPGSLVMLSTIPGTKSHVINVSIKSFGITIYHDHHATTRIPEFLQIPILFIPEYPRALR